MKTSQMLIIGAFLAICAFQTVFALKCIICNSYTDGTRCGHGKDVDESFSKDCETQAQDDGQHGQKFTNCRKIVTWIDFDVNNNSATERIVRKCGYITSKYDNDCYYRGGFGGRQQVCSCDKDNCNSGFSFRADHVLMGVGAILTVLVASKMNL